MTGNRRTERALVEARDGQDARRSGRGGRRQSRVAGRDLGQAPGGDRVLQPGLWPTCPTTGTSPCRPRRRPSTCSTRSPASAQATRPRRGPRRWARRGRSRRATSCPRRSSSTSWSRRLARHARGRARPSNCRRPGETRGGRLLQGTLRLLADQGDARRPFGTARLQLPSGSSLRSGSLVRRGRSSQARAVDPAPTALRPQRRCQGSSARHCECRA